MADPKLRDLLRNRVPTLAAEMDALCAEWLAPLQTRLTDPAQFRTKQINDPIWGSIELLEREVALLDSRLLQRMRGVRQLGLAQLVFPGAGHDRLEHIIGVVGATDRVVNALERQITRWNAEKRKIGATIDQLPRIEDEDRYVLRLAAMFHDLGHGPFSHAIEPVLDVSSPLDPSIDEPDGPSWRRDLKIARAELARIYDLNGTPATSEVIAVMMVLSDAIATLFQHPMFIVGALTPGELQQRIVACIIGAVSGPGATHLSTVISGQVDADRLDFLSRDAHHAGLEIGFDTDRLLSRLEVLQVRDEKLQTNDLKLRQRIAAAPHGMFQQIGIAASGYGSFEQMLIGRTFLYDRLYHHHKVRAAEAMAQRMLLVAERDRKRRFSLAEIFLNVGDDTFLRLVAGEVSHKTLEIGSSAAASLAQGILDRALLHRAFAFRGRFIAAPRGMEEAAESNRDKQWRDIVKGLNGLPARYTVGVEIHALATTIVESLLTRGIDTGSVTTMRDALARVGPEQVIVDLPARKADAIRILARYPDGSLKVPEFSFNPVKWTDAYDLQKRTGYVFCPKEVVPVVALASRIVFLARFGVTMAKDADGYIKAGQAIEQHWLDALVAEGIIDEATAEILTAKRHSLLRIREEDLHVPEGWLAQDPDFAAQLALDLNTHLTGGLTYEALIALGATLKGLWRFVDSWYEDDRTSKPLDDEAALQKDLRRHLRASVDTIEGLEVAGGETDLVVAGQVVIENKFHGAPANPDTVARGAGMQGRRYALALNSQAVIVVAGYHLAKRGTVPEKPGVVKVACIASADRNRVEIRFDLPFGGALPSKEQPEAADR